MMVIINDDDILENHLSPASIQLLPSILATISIPTLQVLEIGIFYHCKLFFIV